MFNFLKFKMNDWARPKDFHPWMEFDPNKLPETELDYYSKEGFKTNQLKKKKSKPTLRK